MFSESLPPALSETPGRLAGKSGPLTPIHGRNVATSRTTPETAAMIWPCDNTLPLPITLLGRGSLSGGAAAPRRSATYFFPPLDERLRVLDDRVRVLDERDPLDFEELRPFDAPERERDDVEREPLAREVVDFEPLRELERRVRAGDFFVLDCRVVPPEARVFRAGVAAGGGAGIAGGAPAAAERVRPPGTDTRASMPSSRSAISAPAAIAAAATRPRKIPTLRAPGLAKIRQTMIATLRRPSTAVLPPRGAGRLSFWPDIASRARAGPATAAR